MIRRYAKALRDDANTAANTCANAYVRGGLARAWHVVVVLALFVVGGEDQRRMVAYTMRSVRGEGIEPPTSRV